MRTRNLITPFILAVALIGCKKGNEIESVPTPVTFEIVPVVTRLVTSGNVTTFETNDSLAISSVGLSTEMVNAKYKVTGDGTLSGEKFFYNEENTAKFYAHYPFTAEYDNGIVTMTVDSDQSTEAKFNANDFMTATAVGDPANGGTVKLSFSHRLTLVKVLWQTSATAESVTMGNILPEVSWNHVSDEYTTAGSVSEISMWKKSETAQEYWALIPSQKIAAETELLTIIDNGNVYKYVTTSEVNFRSNTTKVITLTGIEEDKIEAVFSEIEIGQWVEDNEEIEGLVNQSLMEIISQEAGKNITLAAGTKNNAAEGLWTADVDEGNTIVVDEQNPAPSTISMMINAGKWWDNSVFYRPDSKTASLIKPKWFKLSFDVMADHTGKGFMLQVLKGDESGNVYFGMTNADPKIKTPASYTRTYYPSLDKANEFVRLSYWVNFGVRIDMVTPEGSTTAVPQESPAGTGDYEKVLMNISINTGTTAANAYGIEFKFRNFEFVEVK